MTTQTKKRKKWQLSATFFKEFKRCAMACKLKYVLGLVPAEESDVLRVGTNWHSTLEIMKLVIPCPACSANGGDLTPCQACNATGIQDPLVAVVDRLNECYKEVPTSKTREEWLTERAILLYSLCGYNWRYETDDYETIATEVEFNLPVLSPATGRALPNVTLKGKIDKIVRAPNGVPCIDEHKSTGKGVESDSLFWSHLTLDTQTKLYPYAAQRMQLAGDLEKYGIKASDPLIRTVRYDAWHKPGIKPKKLTQGDSKKFVETGEYMGKKFEVECIFEDIIDKKTGEVVARAILNGSKIAGELMDITNGAKAGAYQIRETPDMYGQRLLTDIGERPDFYFARQEIIRTDDELKAFEREIYNMYHTIKFMSNNDTWWTNEAACEDKFRCSYIPICYNRLDVSNGTVPEGFKQLAFARKDKDHGNQTTDNSSS
ncbi:hypothetical protein LCGC14_1971470 [marine sediment metagenome]|uniref:PD-(D/E)XK endonuclease-like domain-containing protein n=1 Tax=marine sediment metagenome TaxID=412755 RepID=A0A0F9FBS6_9ZZZZ